MIQLKYVIKVLIEKSSSEWNFKNKPFEQYKYELSRSNNSKYMFNGKKIKNGFAIVIM